jgi:hypothetical protein
MVDLMAWWQAIRSRALGAELMPEEDHSFKDSHSLAVV